MTTWLDAEAGRRLEVLAKLLEYPTAHSTALETRLSPGAQTALAPFLEWASSVKPWQAEELYARTFDIQATACLETGWHLFGETYKRGMFLVRMTEATRAFGVACGTELPDHLGVVLRLLARLPADAEPRELVSEVLLPALARMRAAFGKDARNPYLAVLDATATQLHTDFPNVTFEPAHLPVFAMETSP